MIATGPSTLGATRKFRDSLTDRKAELWLTPVMSQDLRDFRDIDLPARLYRGGLPPFLLTDAPSESGFQSWVDSYWAQDIQELFRSGRRQSFLQFVELLLGYRRFEGISAAQALGRLYGASRLCVNFFQPSCKLAEKHRQGARVTKRYHPPQTPCDRLLPG